MKGVHPERLGDVFGLFDAAARSPQPARREHMAIVMITGANSGIGLATAVTLARGKHTVIATMRDVGSAGELQKIVSAEKLSLNVDDDSSVSYAFRKVLAENGRIDVLVNNAGVSGSGSVEELPMAVFREVMETNFFGALR